jgi:hypothetical protein
LWQAPQVCLTTVVRASFETAVVTRRVIGAWAWGPVPVLGGIEVENATETAVTRMALEAAAASTDFIPDAPGRAGDWRTA